MIKTNLRETWISNGNSDEIQPANDGWIEKNNAGYNSEVLTGNSLIDNAGIW